MEKRVQRYTENEQTYPKTRTSKNKYLYDELNNKIGYEELTNLDTQTKIDLSEITGKSISREEYQKTKDYQQLFNKQDEKAEEKVQEKEEKIYDINAILEEARKSREKFDELESKRRLKENDYITLADINKKDEYKKETQNNIDEKELTDLINTITSHNLVNDIKNAEAKEGSESEDLFSELMATSAVDLEGIASESNKKEDDEEEIDNSFYTKSMDLSEQDFELSEEFENDRKSKVKALVIFLVILILIILGVFGYLYLKNKGII